ncbi:MAG: amidohydrolase family protein [Alphaproteobacteria bacterium]|nr:amidohydrolase family protein [Alphaproteobacteria bacterium]
MSAASPTARRVAYRNARLLDPSSGLDAKGGLLTVNGTIADLGPHIFAAGTPDDAEVVDCKGLCLAPGLIDLRASLGEPGAEHKETIATGTRSAAAGGVTSVVVTPDTRPVLDDIALVEFIERQGKATGVVHVYPSAAVTRSLEGKEMTELGMLAEAGAVAFTDGFKSITNAMVMRRALSYATAFGLLISHHTESPDLVGTGVMNQGELATRLGLSGILNESEVIMLERDIRLVLATGARYHAASISTADSVDVIRAAKAQGLPVTCGVSPCHFALNENEVGDYRTFAKVSPPLRSEDDRRAIVAGLRDGTIDVICSNHKPQDQDSKRRPFAQAAFGAVGLETLLPIGLELVHKGELTMIEMLRRLTSAPAQLYRLPGGRLAKGAPADLVLFDPGMPWRIDADAFLSKSKNSPFDRRPVQGRALRTVVEGETVHLFG